jgi:hypothetical protein
MPPAGFEPTISAGERPQTYALDRAASGIGFRISFLDMGEISRGSSYKADTIYGNYRDMCE